MQRCLKITRYAERIVVLLMALALSNMLSERAFAAKLIFESGFESGTFEEELWKYHLYGEGSDSTRKIVTSSKRMGNHALELTIKPNNRTDKNRAEAFPRTSSGKVVPYYWDGPEYWIGFSHNVTVTGAPVWFYTQMHPPDSNTIIANGGCQSGTNAFGLVGVGTDELGVRAHLDGTQTGGTNNMGSATTVKTYPIISNKWTDWVIHFKLGTKNNGFWEIWKDGVKIYEKYNITNVQLYDSCQNNIKNLLPADQQKHYSTFGIYANKESYLRQVIVDEVRIAEGPDGYELVSPGAAATSQAPPLSPEWVE